MLRSRLALRRRMLMPASIAAALVPAIGGSAAELTFDLAIERGQVPQNMRLIRVAQGDVVRLRWRTDRPCVLHMHGYDMKLTLERGAVAEMTFTAGATGRFPVHVHDGPAGASGHTHHEAPLVVVEVHPR